MIHSIDTMTDDERALCRVALRRPCALCSDADGTLSAVAATAEQARLLPGIAQLLMKARELFDTVAIVSGRDLALLWRLVEVPNLTYIGDHGNQLWEATESEPPAPTVDPSVAVALAQFTELPIAETPALTIDLKGLSASIHYRNVADREATRRGILTALAPIVAATNTQIMEGRAVIEVQSLATRTKGDAIAELITTRALRGLFYLGDDRTDMDAFRAAQQARERGDCATISIAIASAEAPPDLITNADLALETIALVPAFLEWLLDEARQAFIG